MIVNMSSRGDDDASIVGRKKKIDDMRKQLENKLIAMAGESEFDRLRKQVADLRTSSSDLRTSSPSASLNASSSDIGLINDKRNIAALGPSNSGEQPLDSGNERDGIQSASSNETETTIKVEQKTVVDPYGDRGNYTGELSTRTRKPHGSGLMKYKDQRVYQGGWKNGQWHGDGQANFVSELVET